MYQLLYDKKNDEEYFKDQMENRIKGMELKDEDFFVDLKMGSQKDIQNMFKANCENKVQGGIANKENRKQSPSKTSSTFQSTQYGSTQASFNQKNN